MNEQYQSETSRCRERLLSFCEGEGVDVGFGGDPIKRTAICVDLPQAYACVGSHPKHLSTYDGKGKIPQLRWFKDGSLDFVFSSHLIEDFFYAQQICILNDWTRVLRVGGNIVLYQPDQVAFDAHCAATGQGLNDAHKERDYSAERFFEKVLRWVNFKFKIAHRQDHVENYSWEMVITKK